MDYKIDTTLERDIDLLIIEEFISEKSFSDIFLSKLNLPNNYSIVKAIHSKTDSELGESDIVFVLNINGILHAIHIENKINAIAMPEQNSRYHLRANKDILNGEYDDYSVMIVAPSKYLEKNKEAQKYEYAITYEQLLEYFKNKNDIRSSFKSAMIERAITDLITGYQWEANPHVVRFCSAIHKYQDEHFPGMTKGTVAWWSTYKTIHKDIEVQFKANKGHCDLAFKKMTYPELYKEYKDKIFGKMTIVETGKSSAIRLEVHPIHFEDNFDDVVGDVHKALEAIKILLDFGNSL